MYAWKLEQPHSCYAIKAHLLRNELLWSPGLSADKHEMFKHGKEWRIERNTISEKVDVRYI